MKRSSATRALLAACVAATAIVGTAGAAVAKPAPQKTAAPRLITITIPPRHADVPSKWWSYPGPPRANVLLPAGYDPQKRYPLVVALHGLNCNYAWFAQTGLTKVFDRLQAIVVMPEGGSGWYTDWWNHGTRTSPSWESYELDDVLPTILHRYRILPQRRYHALMGISMGGLGTAYLGGRLPGFFGSVAPLSGFVDPQWFGQLVAPAMGLTAFAPAKGNLDLVPVDGLPDGFYMAGHNPTRLAMDLKQTRVFVSSGNGRPSAYAGLNHPGSEAEGGIIWPMNKRYAPALKAAGVDVTWQPHPGGHDIPDFAQEIRSWLAWGAFKPGVTHPRSWVNDTVATHGHLWDVGYRFTRPPNAVVRFNRSGDQLSISDAGSNVTLTTTDGCVIHTRTPTTIQLRRACRAAVV